MQERVLYGAGVASFRDVGERVLRADFSGPLTPIVLGCFRRDANAYGQAMFAGAIVVNLRRAVVAVGLEHMMGCATSLTRMPVAFVVDQLMVDVFKAYAWSMAQRGYLRGVFTENDCALAWVQTKVGLGRPAPRVERRSRAL